MIGRSDEWNEMMAQFCTKVSAMPEEASSITIFRDMGPRDQMECFVAGVLLGMMGALDAQTTDRGLDLMEQYIMTCVPVARKLLDQFKVEKAKARSTRR